MKRLLPAIILSVSTLASGQGIRAYTDSTGAYLRPVPRPVGLEPPAAPEGLLWTYSHPTAIPESVSLSPFSGSAWVGQTLNFEALQHFQITGSGVPTFEVPAGSNSPSLVSAAKGADLVVFLDRPDTGVAFQLRAYRSTGGPAVWTRNIEPQYDGIGGLKVSRDGSTVAAAFNVGFASSIAYFLDGGTGNLLQSWTPAGGTVGSVDLTDDGGLCFLQHTTTAAFGRLIDTSTGQETFSAMGSGSGSRYQVSGDGGVLVLGGFSLSVYRDISGSYTEVINFTAPTSWFGWASAVSRDGSTVGVLSHDYASGYVVTATRVWDVASASLLGTFPTNGSGALQGSAFGAAMSDDGDRLAVIHWGTADNAAPEVMVFDRSATLVDQIDPPGSPFSVDMSGDGRYVLVGSKAVHANTFGNGGNTYLVDAGGGCYPDCDGDSVLTLADFGCFQTKFALGDPYADCNGDLALNLADFGCFQTQFALGCP